MIAGNAVQDEYVATQFINAAGASKQASKYAKEQEEEVVALLFWSGKGMGNAIQHSKCSTTIIQV